MAQIILHLNGVFNLYSGIADGAIYESGLTLDELKQHYQKEYGNQGLRELDRMFPRALEKGTSSFIHQSLAATIVTNRAGEKESCLSYKDFVAKYLTIAKSSELAGDEEWGARWKAALEKVIEEEGGLVNFASKVLSFCKRSRHVERPEEIPSP